MNSYALWLYGSRARGDYDERSDVDILCVGTPPDGWSKLAPLADFRSSTLSVSRYTWKEISRMIQCGSLFMHHIHLEGRCLHEHAAPSLAERLSDLPPYQFVRRDMEAFWLSLKDVKESMKGDFSPLFELSVLATIVRHSSVLGCYVIDQPTFGRTRPIHVFATQLGYESESKERLMSLYAFRLSVARQTPPPYHPLPSDVYQKVLQVEHYLTSVQEKVNEYLSASTSTA